jgi:hypothetical protein
VVFGLLHASLQSPRQQSGRAGYSRARTRPASRGRTATSPALFARPGAAARRR